MDGDQKLWAIFWICLFGYSAIYVFCTTVYN
jgi:hypothetical protein